MKIKYLDGTEVQAHPIMAKALIAAKLATEVIVPKKKPTIPNVEWLALRGPVDSGMEDVPLLFFHCKGCGEKMYAKGPTAHLTTQVRHCGQIDLVPVHVGRQYVEYRRIHDKAIVENKRKAEQKAKFKLAEESALAAART
jgi:hypothetical protein